MDENYLQKMFGKIEYLAVADKIQKGGIYITDYSADALLLYSPQFFDSYESILGNIKCGGANEMHPKS